MSHAQSHSAARPCLQNMLACSNLPSPASPTGPTDVKLQPLAQAPPFTLLSECRETNVSRTCHGGGCGGDASPPRPLDLVSAQVSVSVSVPVHFRFTFSAQWSMLGQRRRASRGAAPITLRQHAQPHAEPKLGTVPALRPSAQRGATRSTPRTLHPRACPADKAWPRS